MRVRDCFRVLKRDPPHRIRIVKNRITASRTAGDTIVGLIVPSQSSSNSHPYPTAGTITRSISAAVTITGQAAATSKRREVITYDGTATAKVSITVDGATQNCTLPLPHGRLTCS